MEGVAFSQKSKGFEKTHKNINLAIEEREAREKREPQASQATEHTRREAQNGEKNQSKAPRGTAKPTWREQREHQDCECGGSRAALARALRALAGRLELERFVSFSCVFPELAGSIPGKA